MKENMGKRIFKCGVRLKLFKNAFPYIFFHWRSSALIAILSRKIWNKNHHCHFAVNLKQVLDTTKWEYTV